MQVLLLRPPSWKMSFLAYLDHVQRALFFLTLYDPSGVSTPRSLLVYAPHTMTL